MSMKFCLIAATFAVRCSNNPELSEATFNPRMEATEDTFKMSINPMLVKNAFGVRFATRALQEATI